jgi:hypothetical protein
LKYIPEVNASGEDSLAFTVTDGIKTSERAMVTININKFNHPPVARAQAVTTTAGETQPITLVGTDPEGAPLRYTVVTKPNQGALDGNAPNFRYTPNITASGQDSFAFTVTDGAKTSVPATVTIGINKFNQPPVATAQAVTATAGEIQPMILRGTDPEGATLRYTVVTPPRQGKLDGAAPDLKYIPEVNASGEDSLAFTVTDGIKTSERAMVTININKFTGMPTLTNVISQAAGDDKLRTQRELQLLKFMVRIRPSQGENLDMLELTKIAKERGFIRQTDKKLEPWPRGLGTTLSSDYKSYAATLKKRCEAHQLLPHAELANLFNDITKKIENLKHN